MSLIKKIRQWRANHKIARTIADSAAAFASLNAGAAALDALVQPQAPMIAEARADFYDGMRGPNQLQLDQRITFSDGSPNYTLLPKVFIDRNNDNKGLFGVTPFNYTPGTKPSAGAGIGGFYDFGKVSLLGVLPVVYSAENKATNLNPTLYATIMLDDFLIDPRISYLASISGDGTAHNISFAGTVGYKIDNIILGFDIGSGFDPSNASAAQLKDNLSYQGIIRIDLDEKHRNWLQAYVGKDSVGIGFRANFDLK